jgi:hypothetical protein
MRAKAAIGLLLAPLVVGVAVPAAGIAATFTVCASGCDDTTIAATIAGG